MWTSVHTGDSPSSRPALPSTGYRTLSQLFILLEDKRIMIPVLCGCCKDYASIYSEPQFPYL